MQLAAILCDIRSVHNVGSIFRTADGAGFEKIYLGGITPSPFDRFKKIRPDFAKVALGAEKGVAWESVLDIVQLIQKLKEEGWTIFALEQSEKSIPLASLNSDALKKIGAQRVALVAGNEVGGILPEVLELADVILEIPMLGKKESLNVSVAFGIAAYYVRFLLL
jgi:tRNA G18 (ribose-2'-O)-methylase SpoU